jgi:hypothetical protein
MPVWIGKEVQALLRFIQIGEFTNNVSSWHNPKPAPSPSFLRLLLIRSAAASLRASRTQAATLQVLPLQSQRRSLGQCYSITRSGKVTMWKAQ